MPTGAAPCSQAAIREVAAPYKDAAGNYASGGSHDSKTAAFNHYNENVRADPRRPPPRRVATLQEPADTSPSELPVGRLPWLG